MDMELLTEGFSDEDTFGVDDNNVDYATVEGERCGICMDIVIDRGVLDCCQHWFCFACIDNWATITNLCPLCQNEFQLITCVPVYDTIGSNKADDDSYSRDDDWCIEGKNNTLSFPSYYIDENAVICLDGDGCKVRSTSTTIGEDFSLDTSIACDSCDLWYHAFCVGFDPEGSYESSWLCPRCVVNKTPKKLDGEAPVSKPGHPCGSENATTNCSVEASLFGKVSVAVADDGETAVVVSLIEGNNQVTEEPPGNFLSTLHVGEDLKIDGDACSLGTIRCKLDMQSRERIFTQPNVEDEELKLSLSQEALCSSSSNLSLITELKMNSDGKAKSEANILHGVQIPSGNGASNDESLECGLNLHLGLSTGSSLSVDKMHNNVTEDQVAGNLQKESCLEESLLAADVIPDEKGNVVGITGAKRKQGDHSDSAGETQGIENEVSVKKAKTKEKSQPMHPKDQIFEGCSDDSQNLSSSIAVSKDDRSRHKSVRETTCTNIMDIIREADHKSSKRRTQGCLADISSTVGDNVAGLRVKKIMRRAAEDESAVLVQKLRKEIRETVRNKSSVEFGENLFDPKLLAAFRAAVVGSETENYRLPPVDLKSRKLLLQKGKVREHLTKKIYGIGGRRKRAWTRDCEIEFWKHRCTKISKPEKIETLKSVLNLLRRNSECTMIKNGNEGVATNSILSRLYLADTSVFPRKDDIKPVLASKTTGFPQQTEGSSLTRKGSVSSVNQPAKIPEIAEVISHVSNNKGTKEAISSMKGEVASSNIHSNKCPEKPLISRLAGSKMKSQKEIIGNSSHLRTDKRKWAMEVLARKMAATSRNTAQEEKDNALFKGHFPLLAQLPIDMRPVLAPSRHNKVPISIRQAQLHRLTELLLRKANLPVICRTAETELAVADAVNIEKEVADRSSSKLVYLNLCSQELSHRSDTIKCSTATEVNPSSTATPADRSEKETINYSSDPMVDEALKNAGLLSDSPPNSPINQVEEMKTEIESSKKMEGLDDVFEMASHPELDIYGDFEYDLEDEDFIGASALKIPNLLPEESSKLKLVFSTHGPLQFQNHEGAATCNEAESSFSLLQSDSDTIIGGTTLLDGGEEPSVAECEELYGPDKEPLMNKLPLTVNSTVHCKNETLESIQGVRTSEEGVEDSVGSFNVATADPNASSRNNSSNHSQTSGRVPRKKISSLDADKQSDGCNSVSKKVEAYIKEHIRPLCKSGVITVEQYRWAVGKTTDKVMKYHFKDKNANFLIKEGEKVKKLAEQYVETAQKAGKSE